MDIQDDLQLKILQPGHATEIRNLECGLLEISEPDPIRREMMSWHARWRPEALEHYLPLGWSFGVWQGDKLVAYFLAQPLLFVSGLTQTLWVEHLSFKEKKAADKLVECAYRWSRDKHLQRIVFANSESYKDVLLDWEAQPVQESMHQLQTAKY